MTKVFGTRSTADAVLAAVDLRGKRMLVTGVSAGIGVETARSLGSYALYPVRADAFWAKAEAMVGERF